MHIVCPCVYKCKNVTRPACQNKSAPSTAVDVDTGPLLQASTSGPPPSHTPCLDIWVELTREQSKITPYLFETTVVKTPS